MTERPGHWPMVVGLQVSNRTTETRDRTDRRVRRPDAGMQVIDVTLALSNTWS